MATPLPPDPYKILNVAKDAAFPTIRSSYRKLILTCHPDKIPDEALRAQASDQFTKVQQAYEILSDDRRRQEYDDLAKRAALRAEIMADKGGSRVVPEFVASRYGAPVSEVRNGRVYEVRVPSRSYEDDISSSYDEPRVPSKKSNYDQPSRRSSGRAQEERRKVREAEDERERMRFAKESERLSQSDRRRTRERERKKEYDEKAYSRKAYVVDLASSDSSDSESTARSIRYQSRKESDQKKKHVDARRSAETPRHSGRRDEGGDYFNDYDVKEHSARLHMEKSREAVVPEITPRRPSTYRATSTQHIPPPPPPPIDTGRGSSRRTREVRESSKSRSSGKKERDRRIEIVEASPRDYETPTRKPSIPVHSSDPSNLKQHIASSRREPPLRSATYQPPIFEQEIKPPTMRRSETMPTAPRRDIPSSKAPNRKHAETYHDSGYSSRSGPGTPEMQYPTSAPSQKATRHHMTSSDSEEDHFKGYRTKLVDPEDRYRQERDVSPRARHSSDRPSVVTRGSSANTRAPPARAMAYAMSPEGASPSARGAPPFVRSGSDRTPPLARHGSSAARTPGPLFAEVQTDEPYKIDPYKVQYSPKIRAEDIQYVERRGSDGYGRDTYPWGESRRPTGLRRGESSVA